MTDGRAKLKAEISACLGRDKSAGELVDFLSGLFPDVEVYREDDDLVIRGAGRFLMVRRAGPEQFRVSENAWTPSTNLVDSGGGTKRTLDELIDEIYSLIP